MDIIEEGAELKPLGDTFAFTEGPVWNPVEKHLIFSDIPNDKLMMWRENEGFTTFRHPSNKANGNTYDRQGRLLTCEHATSRVTRTEKDGTVTVLASHYQGKELNSPNDIIVKSDGAIYFSDPGYGRFDDTFGRKREQDLAVQGVYHIDPKSNELTLLKKDFEQPNGLCFSLDESKLFINDTDKEHIRAFDVQDDGKVANGRIWAKVMGEGEGGPDGMKIDSAGNLFCCGPGGIHVFAPDATSLGVIPIPQQTANFAWGGDDLCTLFITASTSLYSLRVKIPGLPLFSL